MTAILACFLGMMSAQRTTPEPDSPTGAAAVTVLFRDLHSRTGRLRVSLFARAAGFPGDEHKACVSKDFRLQEGDTHNAGGAVAITFGDLPPGEYAVSAYRDANDNGLLDTDRLGRPREDWGVSNNPRPLFRAPRFKEARFALKSSEKKVITLALRH